MPMQQQTRDYASAEAIKDPEDELERVARRKKAKLKALLYAKYLTMYGGDDATMQGILGSEDRYGYGPRSGGVG